MSVVIQPCAQMKRHQLPPHPRTLLAVQGFKYRTLSRLLNDKTLTANSVAAA